MEKSYVDAIKDLVAQHYQRTITPAEYRLARKRLIDQMDLEFNGVEVANKEEITTVSND